jgi:broad specificity phosphatase PhoE
MDVFMRLEPLLLDLLAQSQPVVIVSHLGVLRVSTVVADRKSLCA